MPNVNINRRLSSAGMGKFNSLIDGLKGYWPLNDSPGDLADGSVAALYSDAAYGFSAPATVTVQNISGIGGLHPVADFNHNYGLAQGPGQKFQNTSGASLNTAANQVFTATCWVNFSALVNFAPVVSSWGTSGFFLGLSPATFNFNVHDSGNTTHSITGATPSTGQWYFMAGGWDGTNAWMQINAGARSTLAVATLHAYTDGFTIGNYPGGNLATNGLIAGVGYWWRSLLTAEVTRLYGAGSPLFNPFFN